MEHVEQFVKSGIYLRGWSSRTVRTYRQAFTSLRQGLGESGESNPAGATGSTSLTKARLEAWVTWLRQRGVSPGGVNMYVRTVNSYLSWKHAEGLADTRLRLRLLPDPKKPLHALSDAEVRLLLSYRPADFYQARTVALSLLLADTGLRITEALTLEAGSVDWDGLSLEVTGKGNRRRRVPFSLELRKALYRYKQRADRLGPPGRFLFAADSGAAYGYRNAYRDLKSVCAKAGFSGAHVHPHAFRHYFAVGYVRNCVFRSIVNTHSVST